MHALKTATIHQAERKVKDSALGLELVTTPVSLQRTYRPIHSQRLDVVSILY